LSYQQRLMEAAGLGFVSVPRRRAGRRVIDGMFTLGFRRPRLSRRDNGRIYIAAWYGANRIARSFALKSDGSMPDQTILAALRQTADRMDAKRPGGAKRRSRPERQQGHQLYVFHNNEQPKLGELIAGVPPEGGMAAYLADMEFSEGTLPRAAYGVTTSDGVVATSPEGLQAATITGNRTRTAER
jgi:hypothetical protein